MKKLDIYIIRKFLGTFFFAITLIVCVAIVFDLSEKMDNFIDRHATIKAVVFDYYLNFIPYFINMFSYLFVFIAVIFFTSRMASKSEFIAMFSSGISLNRLLVPYFISAFIIALLSFILSNYIIPDSNKVRLEFEDTYIRNKSTTIGTSGLHRQVYPGIYFYVYNYTTYDKIGIRPSIEKFEDGELKSKLTAETMTWDSTSSKWTFENYNMRNINGDNEELISGASIDTFFNVLPSDFTKKTRIIESMNQKELNNYIKEQRLSGTSEIIASEIEKQNRISSPFSTFILTIIGFSLSVKKVRSGGLGINIGLGILLSFAYILFMKFSSVFALSGLLVPSLAAWVPNILFAIIAIGLYLVTSKK
ncbi:LptF/LptG family permease [Bacteroidales bacterium OttesenSCG-928-I21]|nr:LptF/LptG family permease [Bacteroidales bacterium OttesenSCG-928-I21]